MTQDSLAKTENLVMPLGMLLLKHRVQRILKFCHRSRQRSSDTPQNDVDDTVRKELLSQVSEELDEVQETIRESKEHADKIRIERAEQEDIEARRCNLILYRVPESNDVLAEDRRKQDSKMCEQFLNKFNVGIVNEDIRKVFRLGRRNQDQSPRPILVQLGSRQIKNMVMESLYKIKSMDAMYKNIIVAHDMTRKQREECKALVAEAKEKTVESGDCVYRVRGPPGQMRIIRIRTAN